MTLMPGAPTKTVAAPLQRLDRVRLGNGSIIIVTGFNPSRPLNKYRGVLENGQGKEYIFGDKHRPVKIGVADEGHPAILNSQTRKVSRSAQPDVGPMVRLLVSAVLDGDKEKALLMAQGLRVAGVA